MIRIFFLLMILNAKISFAQQINEILKTDIDDIILPTSSNMGDNDKINVFIFLPKTSEDARSKDLSDYIKEKQKQNLIDFDNFNFYRIKVEKTNGVCGKNSLILDGISLTIPLSYDPFYMFIDTLNKSSKYLTLVNERLDKSTSTLATISSKKDRIQKNTPILYFSDLYVFIDFISKKDENKTDKELEKLQAKIDSLLMKNNNYQETNDILSVNFIANLNSLKGINNSEIVHSINPSLSFSFGINHYFENYSSKNKLTLGAGIDLGFNKSNIELSLLKSISDTINNSTDIDGDLYSRIAYAKDITEKISISTFSVTPQFSIRINLLNKNKPPKLFLIVSPGLKFTTNLSSTFSATSGRISYGGLYSQYGSDTMFSGLYDFYQETPVYSNSQILKLKNEFVSLSIPISFQFKMLNSIFINLGINSEFGLTKNILNINSDDKIISTQPTNYNSLLYRNEKVKINSSGIRLGISYNF